MSITGILNILAKLFKLYTKKERVSHSVAPGQIILFYSSFFNVNRTLCPHRKYLTLHWIELHWTKCWLVASQTTPNSVQISSSSSSATSLAKSQSRSLPHTAWHSDSLYASAYHQRNCTEQKNLCAMHVTVLECEFNPWTFVGVPGAETCNDTLHIGSHIGASSSTPACRAVTVFVVFEYCRFCLL